MISLRSLAKLRAAVAEYEAKNRKDPATRPSAASENSGESIVAVGASETTSKNSGENHAELELASGSKVE